MINQSEYQKKWRQENAERFKKCKTNWNKNNLKKVKEAIKKYKKNFHIRERKLDNIRQNTRRKYGRLKKGFEYHHFQPYTRDNFVVLEITAHKFYHRYPTVGSAILIGKSIGGKIIWQH